MFSNKKSFKTIYLDLETYRPMENQDFIGEDIILIGILGDDSDQPTFIDNFKRTREKDALLQLYKYINSLRERYFIQIVGFNILRYDIPLLVAKTLKHGLTREIKLLESPHAHEAEVLGKFWHNILAVDLMQVLLPFNKMRFKGLKLADVIDRLRVPCDIQVEFKMLKADVRELYEKESYENIKKKNSEDLLAVRELHRCIMTKLSAILPIVDTQL